MTSLQCVNCNIRLPRLRRQALFEESEVLNKPAQCCFVLCDHYYLDPIGGGPTSSGSADSFSRSVSRYGLRFTAALLSVLAIIERMARDNNTNKLLNISARLNFNTYYVQQLEKFCTDDKLMDGERKQPAL